MGNIICSNAPIANIGDIVCKIGSILNSIIPVLITLGIIYFIWGIVTYFIGGDEEAKKKGRSRIIYGLIGLVAIFAMDGLILIVINTFNLDQGSGVVSTLVQNNNPGSVGADISSTSGGCISLKPTSKLGELFNYATCLIYSSVIPLIVALAVAMFIWGVVQYVINSDEEAKKEKGKQFMIWGIIGLVVMVGIWGLVRIVGTTFGIEYVIPRLK
jgi:hypothetical protein